MTRGAALYLPDGPPTTSGRVNIGDKGQPNGVLPAAQLSQRKKVAGHSLHAVSNGLAARDQQQSAAAPDAQYLTKPDGRQFAFPPGLSPEQRALAQESPFLDLDSPMTAYEWFKIILYIPVLLVRLLLICTLMPPCWLFSRLITTSMQPNEPFPEWRVRAVRRFVKIWARVLLFLGMSFYNLPVHGREHIAEAEKVRP